jgi:hypothetical protein
MRRIVVAAAIGLALLSAAACTNQAGSPSGSAGASGAASATSGSGGVASPSISVSADDLKVCEDTRTLVTDSTKKFGDEVVKAVQKGGGEPAAVAAVKSLFVDWANGLRIQSGKANNPDLKNALLQYAVGLEHVNAKIVTVTDLANLQDLNTPELAQATEKVQQICG